MTPKPPKAAPRFGRATWLQAAMEVLAREGQAKLRVDTLTKELGVTRGSFYHHFKSREDFVHALLEYWSSAFTVKVRDEVAGVDASAQDKLLILTQIIERDGLDRYDIALRSWAAQEPAVAEQVRKVDLERYHFVRSLFVEMGFEGTDLEDRVHIWLVYQSAQSTVYVPHDTRNDADAILRRHAFLVDRSLD